MQGKRKLNLTLMATAAALDRRVRAVRRQAGGSAAQVDPLGDVERRLLRLQGRRLDGQDRRGGARRRIHRHGQSLSVDHRRHEGRDGWQWRDRLHRRHRHDRDLRAATAASRTTSRQRPSWCTPGTPIRWNPSWRPRRKRADKMQVLEGLQRQAGVLHAGRLHELAELPAHLQGARLRLQARADRSARRSRTRCRPARSSARSPTPRPARRSRRTGRRPKSAWTSRVVNPCPDEVAKLKAAGLAVVDVDPKGAFTKNVGVSEILRACRSCSPTTSAPTCRRTSSTRWSRRSTTRTATSW